MNFTEIAFESVWISKLNVFPDSRGYFYEIYSVNSKNSKTPTLFKPQQSNVSISKKGVLRGIHFSLVPEGQLKWLTCVSGSILDCVIDLRQGSSTFGQFQLIEISSTDPHAILIGSGMGHGFVSLEENTIVNYLLSSPYNPEFEVAINPLDENLGIPWPNLELILSEKDRNGMSLNDARRLKKLPLFKQ